MKILRYTVPLLTFPVGCIAEAYGCWLVLPKYPQMFHSATALLWIQIGINGFGGPYVMYTMLTKASIVLRSATQQPAKKKKS